MNFLIRSWIAVLIFVGDATAGILVDHEPHPYGGPSSDTAFYTPLGQPYWQQVADDFDLTSDSEAISLQWFGFYDADNPPANETMRIRLYDARAGDGLPGTVVYEESFANPSRVATGQIIHTGVSPREFVYSVTFATALGLEADRTYWLEIVQLGDITTKFRWETSVSDNFRLAYSNPAVPNWDLVDNAGDVAFRLNSPEPAGLALVGLLVVHSTQIGAKRRSGRRRTLGHPVLV